MTKRILPAFASIVEWARTARRYAPLSQHSLFTSEAVSRGHPDKVCDQISDAVLDEALARDANARVAVETLVKDQRVVLAGELSLAPGKRLEDEDYDRIVRSVIREIGYVEDLDVGFDSTRCEILTLIGAQSSDIGQGVDAEEQGAGDQGIIFGYACDDTETWMPAPIQYAHELMRRHEEVRSSGPGREALRPDAKSQVTFRYDESGRAVAVDTVVLSTQHAREYSSLERQRELRALVREEIIDPVIPPDLRSQDFQTLINPTGKFEIGGPVGDCGLTGRKIIVDTYGGMARHGGGAFSGKDPSKVDRSAAYAARYVARHVVGGGFARRCEVQLAYAIGWPRPISVRVDTFGTGSVPEGRVADVLLAGEVFDLSPGGIVKMLGLLDEDRGFRYRDSAGHGHFGYPDGAFPWESLDRLDQLRAALGE